VHPLPLYPSPTRRSSDLGHGNFQSPLVRGFFRCGIGMHRYTHHRGTQHASMKYISRLENLENRAVLVVRCFSAVHCLVQVRIKRSEEHTSELQSRVELVC